MENELPITPERVERLAQMHFQQHILDTLILGREKALQVENRSRIRMYQVMPDSPLVDAVCDRIVELVNELFDTVDEVRKAQLN